MTGVKELGNPVTIKVSGARGGRGEKGFPGSGGNVVAAVDELINLPAISDGDGYFATDPDGGFFIARDTDEDNAPDPAAAAIDTVGVKYREHVDGQHIWVRQYGYVRPEELVRVGVTLEQAIQQSVNLSAYEKVETLIDRPYELHGDRGIIIPSGAKIIGRWDGESGFHSKVNSLDQVAYPGTTRQSESAIFAGVAFPSFFSTATRHHRDLTGLIFQDDDPTADFYTYSATLAGEPVAWQGLDEEAAYYNAPDRVGYNEAMNGTDPSRWQNLDISYPFYTTDLGLVGTLRLLYTPILIYHDIEPTTYSDRVIKIAPADAANYPPGAVVDINGNGHYYGGQGRIHHYASLNSIQGDLYDGATIDGFVWKELRDPIIRSLTSAKIAVVNGNPGVGGVVPTDPANGLPVQVCAYAMIDGISITSEYGTPLHRSGMLHCQFHFDRVDGRSFSLNRTSFSDISWRSRRADRSGFELSANSIRSTIKGPISYRKTEYSEMVISGLPARSPILRIGEETTECSYEGDIDAEDFDFTGRSVISVGPGDGNRIKARVRAPAAAGNILVFDNPYRKQYRDLSETQSSVQNNVVTIEAEAGPNLARYVFYQERLAGHARLSKNIVKGSFKSSAPPTYGAVSLGGVGSEVHASFQHGNITIRPGATDYTIRAAIASDATVIGYDAGTKREVTINGSPWVP